MNTILNHPVYKYHAQKNISAEEDWPYCKHDIIHLMDVARIAYILNLENNFGFAKELIYAAALLHDITKWKQIIENIPHNESAIEPTAEILRDCDFDNNEISLINRAILNHRDGPKDNDNFSYIIYKADKLSRPCFFCNYDKDTCDWDKSKKNLFLSY